MKVFITGANGFVGSNAAEFLIARNITIIRVVRNPSISDEKFQKKSEILSYDKFYKTNLSANDSIIHCAGLAHQDRKKKVADSDYYMSNALHAREVFNHSSNFNIGKFVLLSSASVYGMPRDNERISEDHECKPVDAYGNSKILAENMILRQSRYAKKTKIIIVRPPMIYGSGAPGNYAKLVKLVNLGLPLPFGSFGRKRSVLHIHNLCDFFLKVLNTKIEKNFIFNLADAYPLSVSELMKRISIKSKNGVRIFNINPKIIMTLSYLIGKNKEIAKINEGFHLNCDYVERSIGWRPKDKLEG